MVIGWKELLSCIVLREESNDWIWEEFGVPQSVYQVVKECVHSYLELQKPLS